MRTGGSQLRIGGPGRAKYSHTIQRISDDRRAVKLFWLVVNSVPTTFVDLVRRATTPR